MTEAMLMRRSSSIFSGWYSLSAAWRRGNTRGWLSHRRPSSRTEIGCRDRTEASDEIVRRTGATQVVCVPRAGRM